MVFFIFVCLCFFGQSFGIEDLLPGLPPQQMPTSQQLKNFPLPQVKDENVKRTIIHTLANMFASHIRIPQDLKMLLSDPNAVEAVIVHSPWCERNNLIELFFFGAILYQNNEVVKFFLDHNIALEKMKSVSNETPAEFAHHHSNIQALGMLAQKTSLPSKTN